MIVSLPLCFICRNHVYLAFITTSKKFLVWLTLQTSPLCQDIAFFSSFTSSQLTFAVLFHIQIHPAVRLPQSSIFNLQSTYLLTALQTCTLHSHDTIVLDLGKDRAGRIERKKESCPQSSWSVAIFVAKTCREVHFFALRRLRAGTAALDDK